MPKELWVAATMRVSDVGEGPINGLERAEREEDIVDSKDLGIWRGREGIQDRRCISWMTQQSFYAIGAVAGSTLETERE